MPRSDVTTITELLDEFLRNRKSSYSQFAEDIGMSREELSEVLYKYKPVTAEIAEKFARGTDKPAEFWLEAQARFEEQVEKPVELMVHGTIHQPESYATELLEHRGMRQITLAPFKNDQLSKDLNRLRELAFEGHAALPDGVATQALCCCGMFSGGPAGTDLCIALKELVKMNGQNIVSEAHSDQCLRFSGVVTVTLRDVYPFGYWSLCSKLFSGIEAQITRAYDPVEESLADDVIAVLSSINDPSAQRLLDDFKIRSTILA